MQSISTIPEFLPLDKALWQKSAPPCTRPRVKRKSTTGYDRTEKPTFTGKFVTFYTNAANALRQFRPQFASYLSTLVHGYFIGGGEIWSLDKPKGGARRYAPHPRPRHGSPRQQQIRQLRVEPLTHPGNPLRKIEAQEMP